jgi:tripartite-type tricarboxylate transporter receptor subunit TctC
LVVVSNYLQNRLCIYNLRSVSDLMYEQGGAIMPKSIIAKPILKASLLALAIGLVHASAQPLAHDYPGGRPIEMTVMFGAGSAADVTARHLADGMAKLLASPVVVINRTGAGGAIGYRHVSKQNPDGHSIVWNSNSISSTYHSGMLPFDYSAFDAVARVSVESPVLAVRADAPWKDLREFLDDACAHPGKMRVGNSGTGSHTHFSAAALFGVARAEVIAVPFGEGQALVNLLGGRIEAIVQLPAALVAHVKSGELRVLAVLASARDQVFPEVPTAAELELPVSLEMWRGIAVPKGTPTPIIARLDDAIRRTVESQAFVDAGRALGFRPAYLPSREFAKLIASDDAQLAQLMLDLGLKNK